MVMCFSPDCKHYSERKECKKFFRFPTDPKEKNRWIKLLRRQDRSPTPHSLVCSCHFKNDEKSNGPTIYKRNVTKQLTFESPCKKLKTIKRTTKKDTTIVTETITETAVIDYEEPQAGPSGLQQRNPPALQQLKSPLRRSPRRNLNPPFTAMLEADNYFLKEEVKKLTSEIKQLKIRFTFDNIKHSDSLVSMYTGIPTSDLFEILFELMSRFKLNYYAKWPEQNVVREINPKDQLLLTLMKLHMNILFEDLAVRFSISRATATNAFMTWLYALHEVLFKGFMDKIPSREKNKLCMPTSFSVFTNCKVILDCTEVPAIHPKSMHKQKLTYSAYKHRNTLKGLVGVAPNGVITFISDLYPGSISDKKITQHCGITENLVAGDLVLADKGFLIQDCVPQGVMVNIPPFLNTPQFSKEQVILTRTIARARIHVERAIRRIKCYSILNVVPATLMPHASVVFQVCGALTNFQFPLIREVQGFFKE